MEIAEASGQTLEALAGEHLQNGALPMALFLYQKAREHYQGLGKSGGIPAGLGAIRCLACQANCLHRLDGPRQAARSFQTALGELALLAEHPGPYPEELLEERCRILLALTALYAQTDTCEEMLQYGRLLLDAAGALPPDGAFFHRYQALCSFIRWYLDANRPEVAVEHFVHAIALCEAAGRKKELRTLRNTHLGALKAHLSQGEIRHLQSGHPPPDWLEQTAASYPRNRKGYFIMPTMENTERFSRIPVELYPERFTQDGVFTVPQGVTTLEDFLFSHAGDRFYCLEGVHTIRLPATVREIGASVFEDSLLKHISLSQGLEKIGANAFMHCEELEALSLPSTLTTIGKKAFANCHSLGEIQIPAGVTQLPDRCFSCCEMLSFVHLSQGLTHIGEAAFSGCDSLESLPLPQSLTTLGAGAFEDCISLEEITLPPLVNTLPKGLFRNCESLKAVTLPEGLLRIEENAFWGCTSLSNVTIPSTVEFIHPHAFCFCGEQLRLHFAPGCKVAHYTPDYLTDIPPFAGLTVEKGALSGTYKGPKELHLPPGVFFIDDLEGEGAPLQGVKILHLPPTMKEVEWFAFEDCPTLEEVFFPPQVTTIGFYAFKNCAALKKVHLSEGLETIETDAFADCPSLRSLTLPASVTEVDGSLFAEGLEVHTTPGGWIAFEDGMYINRKTQTLLFCPCAKDGQVTIPADITVIGKDALAHCKGLTRLTIPAHVKRMESCDWEGGALKQVVFAGEDTTLATSAFLRCPSLSKITLPKNLKKLDAMTFSHCSSLEEIQLPPGLVEIGMECFCGCRSLKRLTIPAGVHTIWNRAFQDCISLEELTLPEGMDFLAYELFSGCRRLRKITIPSTVKQIISHAFWGCTTLEEVLLPQGLLSIGESAFQNCRRLKSLTIPKSVIKIEEAAFKNCIGMELVVEKGSYGERYAKKTHRSYRYAK